LELVVSAVERGVPDLQSLKLLVEPERPYPQREGDRIDAQMNERSACDFHGSREGVDAADVSDVLLAHLRLDPIADGVDRLGEAPQALLRIELLQSGQRGVRVRYRSDVGSHDDLEGRRPGRWQGRSSDACA